MLTHSHHTAIIVCATVIFLFDNLREKRLVPLTKQSGIACFKNSLVSEESNSTQNFKALLKSSMPHKNLP